MNKQRRKDLDAIAARYRDLIAKLGDVGAQFESLKGDLESLRDEEQEYLDGMPESFQDGEKGDKAREAIDGMENAVALIEAITEFCETSDSEAGEFESELSTAKGE